MTLPFKLYSWGVAATLAAVEEAVRDGRIVLIQDEQTKQPIAALTFASEPLTLRVPKPKPERCFERPHKKWPVRR